MIGNQVTRLEQAWDSGFIVCSAALIIIAACVVGHLWKRYEQ